MGKQEEWRDIVGYEGSYQISSLARVKSLSRQVDHGKGSSSRSLPETILKPALNGPVGSQYWHVNLYRQGKATSRRIHLLLLEAFMGPRPEGFEGCHNDGNPNNNSLENLRWDTKSSNQYDRVMHGTDRRGEKSHYAKLTESQVIEIRAKIGSASHGNIAKQYGVSRPTISMIMTRKSWNHI